jgi:hypothetical protein
MEVHLFTDFIFCYSLTLVYFPEIKVGFFLLRPCTNEQRLEIPRPRTQLKMTDDCRVYKDIVAC